MHVLVTGGTGFIGSALCAELAERDCEVSVLSRSPNRVAKRCSGARGISDLQQLNGSPPVDVLINLAGAPIADRHWSEKRKQVLRDSRVGITQQLAQWCHSQAHWPSVVISGSAIGFYGDQGDRILDEHDEAVSDFPHRLCKEWEDAAHRFELAGSRLCILRTGLVVAKGGGFLQRMLPAFRFGLGGRIGSGEQWMSWIHRDDLVALILYLMDKETLSGVFNGTAPYPVTNAEFTDTLAGVLGRKARLPVPEWLLKLAMGEMSMLLLGGQRVLPKQTQLAGFDFRYDTLEEALREVVNENAVSR